MGRDELTCVIFMIVLVRLLPQTLTISHTQTGVLLLDGLLIIEHNYSNKHYKHTRTSYASVASLFSPLFLFISALEYSYLYLRVLLMLVTNLLWSYTTTFEWSQRGFLHCG